MNDNLRGSLLMVAAMAGFALEDTLIKYLSDGLPMGQVVAMLGAVGMVAFAIATRLQGQPVWTSACISRPILLRSLGEMIATLGFVSAYVLTTLSSASAILQATPLAVTLGAALFLGEYVGWRRWCAIFVGFFGVLLIVRPGLEGFAPASLFAVLAVAGLALRDLAVRRVPVTVSSMQVATWGFAVVVPTGLLMMLGMGTPAQMPAVTDFLLLAVTLLFGGLAYYAIIAAMRTGDVAVVVPFRYTRLIFALLLGVIVFGERLDLMTLIGGTLIVGAGLFTIWRETRVRRIHRESQPSAESTGWN